MAAFYNPEAGAQIRGVVAQVLVFLWTVGAITLLSLIIVGLLFTR
jgi:hypothetical protein